MPDVEKAEVAEVFRSYGLTEASRSPRSSSALSERPEAGWTS